MVSFQCDNCCDVVKKPKLDQHRQRCWGTFTCIDCSTTFKNQEYKSHTSCISEAEKYQKSVYKAPKQKGNNKAANGDAAAPPISIVSELKTKAAGTQRDETVTKRKAEDVVADKKESKRRKEEDSNLDDSSDKTEDSSEDETEDSEEDKSEEEDDEEDEEDSDGEEDAKKSKKNKESATGKKKENGEENGKKEKKEKKKEKVKAEENGVENGKAEKEKENKETGKKDKKLMSKAEKKAARNERAGGKKEKVKEEWTDTATFKDFSKSVPLAVRAVLKKNKKITLQDLRKLSIRKLKIHPANKFKKRYLGKSFDTNFMVATDEEGRVLVL